MSSVQQLVDETIRSRDQLVTAINHAIHVDQIAEQSCYLLSVEIERVDEGRRGSPPLLKQLRCQNGLAMSRF